MQPFRTDKKPIDQKIKYESTTTWLTPKLVAEVKFSEWTNEGEMRHPVFLGLRADKKALDVIRETSMTATTYLQNIFRVRLNVREMSSVGNSEGDRE